jgi:hypothetical protein
MSYSPHCCEREREREREKTWNDYVGKERKKKKTLDDCDNPE